MREHPLRRRYGLELGLGLALAAAAAWLVLGRAPGEREGPRGPTDEPIRAAEEARRLRECLAPGETLALFLEGYDWLRVDPTLGLQRLRFEAVEEE